MIEGICMSGTREKEPAPSSSLGAHTVVEVKAGVFKDTCLSLLDEVNQGEFEVVVTKHGAPVARVVAESGNSPSAHGFMSGTVLEYGDLVSPDFDVWGDLA
jgi:antitoxin (DNA-binding transcriptional repressor) of toxin-antitoxin stability system